MICLENFNNLNPLYSNVTKPVLMKYAQHDWSIYSPNSKLYLYSITKSKILPQDDKWIRTGLSIHYLTGRVKMIEGDWEVTIPLIKGVQKIIAPLSLSSSPLSIEYFEDLIGLELPKPSYSPSLPIACGDFFELAKRQISKFSSSLSLIEFEEGIRESSNTHGYTRIFNLKGHPTLIIGEWHQDPRFGEIKKAVANANKNSKCTVFLEGIIRDPKSERIVFPKHFFQYSRYTYGLERETGLFLASGLLGMIHLLPLNSESTSAEITASMNRALGALLNILQTSQGLEKLKALADLITDFTFLKKLETHIQASSLPIEDSLAQFAAEKSSIQEWIAMFQVFSYSASKKIDLNSSQRSIMDNVFNNFDIYRSENTDIWEKIGPCVDEMIEVRNRDFANVVLEILPDLPSGMPIILIVGNAHLNGTTKLLMNARESDEKKN